MTVDDITTFIKGNSEKDIYDKYLLGQDVWYFQNHIVDEDPLLYYDKFKKFISSKLNIHFHNISIIGSAKTKFSFSPSKQFKEFNEDSDFDIVLVSNELYTYFWSAFYEISQNQKINNYSNMTSNIFRKFISVKDDDPHFENEDLKNWQRKLSEFKTQLQLEYKIYCDINYRIYANWESVESYHINGIKKLKQNLDEAN
ncbi:hypothetical protein H8R23_14680 [Flavobacterium sp. F-380]|uniref:Polymerase nucleotidyl transferase domain-containing protein n=1 Tax=Flavobacterium kayseriense TaxID=2764714 RepID=A0ABR7JAX5_9FLAO|nr:hypothetical protein [Flavobacterium kayseriense]MBC5842656.1 hypothetical protein [Flavobacterium kayseriense]MBC5849186.1 hypothetical protein [Flavobacterium kayseriense]